MRQVTETEATKALMHWFLKKYDLTQASAKVREDYLRRGLVCTPFVGGYGKISGWIICVNGSPPKGTLVVFGEGPPNAPAYYLSGNSRRVSGDNEIGTIKQFVKRCLTGQEKAVTVDTSMLFPPQSTSS